MRLQLATLLVLCGCPSPAGPFVGDLTFGPRDAADLCPDTTVVVGAVEIRGLDSLEPFDCLEAATELQLRELDVDEVTLSQLDVVDRLLTVRNSTHVRSVTFPRYTGGTGTPTGLGRGGGAELSLLELPDLRQVVLPSAWAVRNFTAVGVGAADIDLRQSSLAAVHLERAPLTALRLPEGQRLEQLTLTTLTEFDLDRIRGLQRVDSVHVRDTDTLEGGLPARIAVRALALEGVGVERISDVLPEVSTLTVRTAPQLRAIDVPVESVTVQSIPSLVEIDSELPLRHLSIVRADALESLAGVRGAEQMDKLVLSGAPALTNLPDLGATRALVIPARDESPVLELVDLPALTSLGGLMDLERIEGHVRIVRTGITDAQIDAFVEQVEIDGQVRRF